MSDALRMKIHTWRVAHLSEVGKASYVKDMEMSAPKPSHISQRNAPNKGQAKIYKEEIKIRFSGGSERIVRYDPIELLEALAGDLGLPYDFGGFRITTSTQKAGLKPALHRNDYALSITVRPSIQGPDLMILSWRSFVKALFRLHPQLAESYSQADILARPTRRSARVELLARP